MSYEGSHEAKREIRHKEGPHEERQKRFDGYRSVLRQREYMKILAAGMINRFGDSVDAIAFTWLVYALTKNAAWSAFIFAANQLPTMIVQPFAGALVEHMDKKRIMVGADLVRGIVTVCFGWMYLTDGLNPWLMLGFTLINSSVEAFRIPAGMAVLPQILNEKYYTYGTALDASISRIVELAGMGAAGVIIGVLGIHAAIFIDAVTFFGSAFILLSLNLIQDAKIHNKLHIKVYLSTLKEGVVYVKCQPVVRNFCIMAIVLNAFIVPLNALMGPLTAEILGQGSEMLSALGVFMTLGMGLGSAAFPAFSEKMSVRQLICICGTGIGLCIGAYIIGGLFGHRVFILWIFTGSVSFFLGICISLFSTALSVQFMRCVPKDYMARVGSIFNAGATAAIPLASALVGSAATVFEVSYIFVVSGSLCVVLFICVAVLKVRFE